jgi:DNA (cytosine-5)-methyltransferase 1
LNIDLFAGIGGWEAAMPEAFQRATWGVELDHHAVATRNNLGLITLHSSVADLAPDAVIDTLLASPPCQAFSTAGKGKGMEHMEALLAAVAAGDWSVRPSTDPNVWLPLELGRWVEGCNPRAIAFEQVPAVKPLWEQYALWPLKRGYSVWTDLLHAEEYGVPQTRKRAVLMARRDAEVSPPLRTHARYRRGTGGNWVTVHDAIGALGVGDMKRKNGTVRNWNEPSPTVTASYDNGNFRKFPAWCMERPATTIVGSFRPDVLAPPTWRAPGDGPRQNQPDSLAITLGDALALQSFPPHYEQALSGPKTAKWRQVGNAVPPLMGKAILEALSA